MAHGIIGERFLSRNLSAWHDLGTVFREDETVLASEAVTRVAGDVLVTAEPLSYLDPEGQPSQHGSFGHRASPPARRPRLSSARYCLRALAS